MKIKRLLLCIFMIIATAFGVAITLRIAIGVGAWDALAMGGSLITGIRVGTVGIILNLSCVAVQLAFMRKNFKIKHALQIVLCFTLGYAVNFFFYDVLGSFYISNYFLGIILLILAYTYLAFTVSFIMLLDAVIFPLEGACKVISHKTGIKFHILRQGVDVISVVLAVIMSFAFSVPLAVREGTIIGMLMFGPLIGMFTKLLKPMLQRYDLADSEEGAQDKAESVQM